MSNGSSDLVACYFECWRSFDMSKLRVLFAPGARYTILPRERTLVGIEEIARYWERNALRQRGLAVDYQVILTDERRSTVLFTARFDDIDEAEHQSVTGTITFHFRGGRIAELSEHYQKTSSPLQ
jgi:hypothetical protein